MSRCIHLFRTALVISLLIMSGCGRDENVLSDMAGGAQLESYKRARESVSKIDKAADIRDEDLEDIY